MNVCVIPARGGSKRIPGKNVRSFCGRPIIEYSIRAARAAGCFDRIVVSTDSEEIAAVARRLGAEVPFLRPPELADDVTGTNAVVAHALSCMREEGTRYERAACIYATAPFLTSDVVRSGLDLLLSANASFVVTVTTFPYPIERALRLDRNGRLGMFFPENRSVRSQDLGEAYHDAGQLYWGTAEAFLSGESMFTNSTMGLVVPRTRVQDIDTPEDWSRAEAMYRTLALGH